VPKQRIGREFEYGPKSLAGIQPAAPLPISLVLFKSDDRF
jgi:hypothetical protein